MEYTGGASLAHKVVVATIIESHDWPTWAVFKLSYRLNRDPRTGEAREIPITQFFTQKVTLVSYLKHLSQDELLVKGSFVVEEWDWGPTVRPVSDYL